MSTRRFSLLALLIATACGGSAPAPVSGTGGHAGQFSGASGASGSDAGSAGTTPDASAGGGAGGSADADADADADAGAGAGGTALAGADRGNDVREAGDVLQPLVPIRVLGGDPNALYCDFVFEGEGLDEFEGTLVNLRVGNPLFQRVAWTQTRVVNGKFSVIFPQALERGSPYKRSVAHFDVDGDGRCGPADRTAINATSRCVPERLVIRPTPLPFRAPSDPTCRSMEVCRPYDQGPVSRPFLDMKVIGSGFGGRDGSVVRVVTRNAQSSALLGVGRALIADGRFVVYLPKGYERNANQNVFWFVGNDPCDAVSATHLGSVTAGGFNPSGNDPFDVVIIGDSIAPPAPPLDACSAVQSFATLGVTAMGFGAHEGERISYLTRTALNGAFLGTGGAIVSGGAASFEQIANGYERRSPQEVLWYVDAAANGGCDTAGGDHVGAFNANGIDPAGNEVASLPITDGHVAGTTSSDEICAALNGCR